MNYEEAFAVLDEELAARGNLCALVDRMSAGLAPMADSSQWHEIPGRLRSSGMTDRAATFESWVD
jgi:hypothetical protein